MAGCSNMSMGDFLDIDIPPPTWLLEDMLTEAGLAILGAKPKVGKSTFTRSLAVSVARGEKFLGRRTKQGPVCYGGFEEDPSFVKAHLQTMGVTKSDPIYPFLQPPPKNVLGQLEASIERIKPTLVILDPLVHLVSITDENKYFEMHNALAPFSALARRHQDMRARVPPQPKIRRSGPLRRTPGLNRRSWERRHYPPHEARGRPACPPYGTTLWRRPAPDSSRACPGYATGRERRGDHGSQGTRIEGGDPGGDHQS